MCISLTQFGIYCIGYFKDFVHFFLSQACCCCSVLFLSLELPSTYLVCRILLLKAVLEPVLVFIVRLQLSMV